MKLRGSLVRVKKVYVEVFLKRRKVGGLYRLQIGSSCTITAHQQMLAVIDNITCFLVSE